MAAKLKFGDWVLAGGKVRFVLTTGESTFLSWHESGSTLWFKIDDVKLLPDCTGFDWQPPKPIEPPECFRLLKAGETTCENDLSFSCDQWMPIHRNFIGEEYCSKRFVPMARKIEPQYRPFASAAELKPFRDRWVKWKDPIEFHIMKIGAFDDRVVWPACASVGRNYQEAFCQWQFEDGTPFGVKIDGNNQPN